MKEICKIKINNKKEEKRYKKIIMNTNKMQERKKSQNIKT
jgi:hypothetical protein